jgi:TolA-binding protein
MVEIWLSALTVITLLLALRLVKKENAQHEPGDGNLQAFIAEFEQENKEWMRSMAQMKRMVDIELAGVKEELSSLQEKVAMLQQQVKLQQQLVQSQPVNIESQTFSSSPSSLPIFLKEDYQDIPALYLKGMSSHEIARKLGIGDGEVEMVVQMLKKQGFLPTN